MDAGIDAFDGAVLRAVVAFGHDDAGLATGWVFGIAWGNGGQFGLVWFGLGLVEKGRGNERELEHTSGQAGSLR